MKNALGYVVVNVKSSKVINLINCAADAIYAKWKTNATFTGHVNVRYAPNRYCFQVLITNNQIELLVPHLDCQVNRIRSLNPPGLILETSVLISFHPEFITSGDRIYVLKCFHNRTTKKNNDGTIVLPKGIPFDEETKSNLTSLEVPESNPPEEFECSYRIKDENGDEIESAEVGQLVVHHWSCRNTKENQCLFVSNCILRTYDSQHELVGKNGCSKDLRVMPELEYDNSTSIKAKLRVFGVAQRPVIHFQCQLNLVDSEESAFCVRPTCEKSRRKRDILNFINRDSTKSFDILSQELEIVQPGNFKKKKSVECGSEMKVDRIHPEGTVCVSNVSFIVVTAATIIVAICTLLVVIYVMWRRFRYMDVPSSES
ncbi:hypothetical protein FO519_006254 [Halicephalobus sp. NKZ332]|nr:hypothetical protein FO519_006254 [Halicephalobus sp. NKZ332]